jgi:hypothetical protein
VDPAGHLFVSDRAAHRLYCYRPDGSLYWKRGGQGFEVNHFETPAQLAVDAAGRVYVSDEGNSRVAVWDGRGFPLQQRPRVSMLAWQMSKPGTLALGPDSSLILADGRGRLVRSDANGNLQGMTEDQTWPLVGGLAVDADGSLWVMDGAQGRLVHLASGSSPTGQPGLLAARVGGAKAATWQGPSLLAWPNPAHHQATVRVSSNADALRARVVLLTLTGEVTDVIPVQPQPGTQDLLLDLNGKASGIYFLSYQEDRGAGYKQEKIFKLAVVR